MLEFSLFLYLFGQLHLGLVLQFWKKQSVGQAPKTGQVCLLSISLVLKLSRFRIKLVVAEKAIQPQSVKPLD